jgi:hypothetical protein
MSSAKLSRDLPISCAGLSFDPAGQKMRGVTPHFNLNGRCYHRYVKQKYWQCLLSMLLASRQWQILYIYQ